MRGPERGKGCAHQGQDHNDEELLPGEEDRELLVDNERLLHRHGVTNDHADHDARETAGQDQDHGLVEVEQLDAELGEADRPQHPDLLCLFVQVR